MKWKAVIFDRDGTLFESLPVILEAFRQAIHSIIGKEPTDQELFAAFGPAEIEVLTSFVPADRAREAYDRFYDYYKKHFNDVILFPGMRELLDRLHRANVKLMLFTGGGMESTRFCLENAKILSYFNGIITGEAVVHPKPHPEGVLQLINEGHLNPAETLVVGDAPADISAGKRAGAVTVLARWSQDPQKGEFPVQPDHVFDSLRSFEDFLFSE